MRVARTTYAEGRREAAGNNRNLIDLTGVPKRIRTPGEAERKRKGGYRYRRSLALRYSGFRCAIFTLVRFFAPRADITGFAELFREVPLSDIPF